MRRLYRYFYILMLLFAPFCADAAEAPQGQPAGIQVTAAFDKSNGEYVLNGRKMWNTNGCGWDKKGADISVVIARIDRKKGGQEGLAAFIVPRVAEQAHKDAPCRTPRIFVGKH